MPLFARRLHLLAFSTASYLYSNFKVNPLNKTDNS